MSNENLNIQQINKQKPKKPFVNNSGKGKNFPVPNKVKKKFNWGAFWGTWIWGIANKSYSTLFYLLLAWIPIINIIVPIWYGIKGNEWAWHNKHFKSISNFHDVQRRWATWTTIISIILIILSSVAYSTLMQSQSLFPSSEVIELKL